jgi:membrane-bound ClpP family serine protease
MKIGAGLFLIAVGAVLRFAVTKQVNGVSLGTVGVIMMIVGAVGLLITFIMMSTRRRTDVVYGHNSVSYVEPAQPVDPRL